MTQTRNESDHNVKPALRLMKKEKLFPFFLEIYILTQLNAKSETAVLPTSVIKRVSLDKMNRGELNGEND